MGAGSQGYPVLHNELGRRSEEEAFTLGFWLPGSILVWGKQIFHWQKAQRNWTSDTVLCPTAPGTEVTCVSMPGAEYALLSSRS